MPSPAPNTGIAKPRSHPRRHLAKKLQNAGFLRKDSVINSHFNVNLFGSAQSNNRKQVVYTKAESSSQSNDKHRQSNLEANVGQMDRLNRIKAASISGSK
jgi:hypothetical protein